MLRGIALFGVVYALMSTSVGHAHDTGTTIESLAEACEAKLVAKPTQGGWANKVLVLDTNIIFNDPNSIYRFPGATIVIPGAVMSEVGKHKTSEKLGLAARQFIRTIRGYIDNGAQTKAGIDLGNGSILKLDSRDYTGLLSETTYDQHEMDNRILATAMHNMRNSPDGIVTYLVTDDGELMIKANGEGIPTMGLDYQFSPAAQADEDVLPENYLGFELNPAALDQFLKSGMIAKPEKLNIKPNQFVMFRTATREGSQETLGRYFYDRLAPENSGIRKLKDVSKFPIQPKNMQQAMLLDVLLDPSILLVISQSPAGTGKTFLAIVAGLLQLADYDKLLVTRTLVQIGKTDLGAMPGGMDEKLGHWMPNIDDAFEALTKALRAKKDQERAERTEAYHRGDRPGSSSLSKSARRSREREWKILAREAQKRGQAPPVRDWETQPAEASFTVDKNKVHLVPFPHLRGRSIADAFMILDEAQNTSLHEMKTFLTRAGDGTKITIAGDKTQIDSPQLNERNNGLTIVSKLFTAADLSDADRSMVAHIQLTQGVRSDLADLARRLFEKLANPTH